MKTFKRVGDHDNLPPIITLEGDRDFFLTKSGPDILVFYVVGNKPYMLELDLYDLRQADSVERSSDYFPGLRYIVCEEKCPPKKQKR